MVPWLIMLVHFGIPSTDLCLFLCRLKINNDSHEFILEFGAIANSFILTSAWARPGWRPGTEEGQGLLCGRKGKGKRYKKKHYIQCPQKKCAVTKNYAVFQICWNTWPRHIYHVFSSSSDRSVHVFQWKKRI